MSLGVRTLIIRIADHGKQSGAFQRVLIGEPKSPPGPGRTMAVWAAPMAPAGSGLASTSMALRFLVRVYVPYVEPSDTQNVELSALEAVDVLLDAYNGDFTLGGTVRQVDIFGEHGQALVVDPGYVTLDSKIFRVMDITLPIVVNDVYDQAA